MVLKDFYLNNLAKYHYTKAFKRFRGKSNVTESQNDMYVDLNLVTGYAESKITIEEYFDNKYEHHKYVLIEGIAGIGKSSFVNSLILRWANNEILKQYDLVLKFSCRELNVLKNVNSWQELLQKKYPKVCDRIFIKWIENSGVRTLIILDGLDEFKFRSELSSLYASRECEYTIANVVFDLITTDTIEARVMICGRTESCEDIYIPQLL